MSEGIMLAVGLFWVSWFMLATIGIVPDPITPYIDIATGNVPVLHELKEMDCDTLGSWIVNKTGTIASYQTEAGKIFETKCLEADKNV